MERAGRCFFGEKNCITPLVTSKPLCEAASFALVDRARSDLLQYNFDADVDLSQFSL
jgi:hypothetical protein